MPEEIAVAVAAPTNTPPPVAGATGAAQTTQSITQPPETKHWTSTFDGLDDKIRSNPALQPFKTPADAIKAYADVQPLLGRDKAPIPTDWNDAAQVKAFNAKIGVPEKASDYQLGKTLAEKFPGYALDPKRVELFENIALKSGAMPRQAQAQAVEFVAAEKEMLEQHRQSIQVEQANALNKFKQERGSAYDTDVAMAHRALVNFGNESILQKLDSTGLGNDPEFIQLFAKIGMGLKEDSAHTSGSAPGTLQSNSVDSARVRINEMKADKNFMDALQNQSHPNHKTAAAEWTKIQGLLPARK